MQVAAGQIGQPPVPNGQVFQFTMSTLGRLDETEQFDDMISRRDNDGRVTRLKDVAASSSARKNQDITSTLDGQPSVGLGDLLSCPAPTPWKRPNCVQTKMEELKEQFPGRRRLRHRLRHHAVHRRVDQAKSSRRCATPSSWSPSSCCCSCRTGARRSSRWSPCRSPSSAPSRSWRCLGFSLNNLTLFGLVLAIGIVVDDAIVVVEAVEHHIEHGLSPRDATIKAMEQVSGPVIAVGLVLVRRVRAVRVHRRHHRAVLPAVRPDHRRLDAHLGVQLADAQPGALAALLLQAARTRRRSTSPCRDCGIAFLAAALGFLLSCPSFARTGSELDRACDRWIIGRCWRSDRRSVLRGRAVRRQRAAQLCRWAGSSAASTRGFTAPRPAVYTRVVGRLLRVSVVVLVVYGGLLG